MASRSLEKAQVAMTEIEADGIEGTLSAVQLDVTDETSIAEVVAYVQQQFGRLDALINNAASGSMDPDIRTRFQLCLTTNVMGPALVAAAFRSLLLKSENPYSIYVSSGAGSLTRSAAQQHSSAANMQNMDAYHASKAALNMLAVMETREYGPRGLKVFAMSPGFVRSNLRGSSDEARSGWGKAGDPEVSGETILSILQGKRDGDKGLLIYKDGVYPW